MSTLTLSAAYVEPTVTGAWRVAGTRVSLESVIFLHLEGETPAGIVREFPTLTLEQVHGVIAFYLRNREAIDAYLDHIRELWVKGRAESEVRNAALLARIRAHRDGSKDGAKP